MQIEKMIMKQEKIVVDYLEKVLINFIPFFNFQKIQK